MRYALASRTNAPVLRDAYGPGKGVVRLLLTCGTRAIVTVPPALLDAFEDALPTLGDDYSITLEMTQSGYVLHAISGIDILITDGFTTYARPAQPRSFSPRSRTRETAMRRAA